MKTNHVLVDFENTPDLDLKLIVGHPVKVYVLLGEKQKTLPVELVDEMLLRADKLKLVRTLCGGKNALDFVLAFIAGTLVSSDPDGYYHVVSKDKGFDALVAHLRSNKISAARHESFRQIPLFRAAIASSADERAAQYRDHLALMTKNRPTRKKTLTSSVNAHFAKLLSEHEVESVVASLVSAGFVEIDPSGRVSYERMPSQPNQALEPTAPKRASAQLER
jgi:hypothetical protein